MCSGQMSQIANDGYNGYMLTLSHWINNFICHGVGGLLIACYSISLANNMRICMGGLGKPKDGVDTWIVKD